MSVAHAPAETPVVVIACPTKTYADGREIKVFNDRTEITFWVESVDTSTGCSFRRGLVCIVLTKELHQACLRESLPRVLEAALADWSQINAMH